MPQRIETRVQRSDPKADRPSTLVRLPVNRLTMVDRLRTARGVLLGVVVSLCLWALIVGAVVVWRL